MTHVQISSVFASANRSDESHDSDVFQKEAEIVANLEFATHRFRH